MRKATCRGAYVIKHRTPQYFCLSVSGLRTRSPYAFVTRRNAHKPSALLNQAQSLLNQSPSDTRLGQQRSQQAIICVQRAPVGLALVENQGEDDVLRKYNNVRRSILWSL
jgi:hypothetical protein